MARRSTRRETRPDPSRIDPTPQRTAPGPSQRSTFRVAHAQRTLADALPAVVYRKPERRRRQVSETTPALSRAVPKAAVAKPQGDPQHRKPVEPGVKLQRLEHCKKRPNRRERKRGGGGGPRKFVPWC